MWPRLFGSGQVEAEQVVLLAKVELAPGDHRVRPRFHSGVLLPAHRRLHVHGLHIHARIRGRGTAAAGHKGKATVIVISSVANLYLGIAPGVVLSKISGLASWLL